ncbi:MAG: GTPase RsgA [Eggerthellaceae bacterium]
MEISFPRADKGIIERVLPLGTLCAQRPTERMEPQVLAANFDKCSLRSRARANVRRLERELVLAHESGAEVIVLLTKADQAESSEEVRRVQTLVERVAQGTRVLVVSSEDPESVEEVRSCVPSGCIGVLLGKSGVGKSSLVNLLVGVEVQATGSVREGDGNGRHTTVSREMVRIPAWLRVTCRGEVLRYGIPT